MRITVKAPTRGLPAKSLLRNSRLHVMLQSICPAQTWIHSDPKLSSPAPNAALQGNKAFSRLLEEHTAFSIDHEELRRCILPTSECLL
jgi:hypothetical protein